MAYSGEGSLIEGQVEGDPKKTVVPVAVDAAGHLIIDIESSSITIGSVDLNDGAGNPISSVGGSLDVNVTNFPTTQAVTEANLDKSFGTWSYYAGTVGTVTVAAGQRILSIAAHSTTGGSFTINGGASIPIPANVGFAINPLGNITAPTVVYTGTDFYFIEVVS